MTEQEVKQKIIDRIGELAKEADALTLTSLTTTLGMITHLDGKEEQLFKNSASSLGLLAGLTMGAMGGNSFNKDLPKETEVKENDVSGISE